MLEEKDDLAWYARKADRLRQGLDLSPAPADPEREARVAALLKRLERGGIRGSAGDRTLYTRRLPPGCRGCLSGKGTTLYATGLCTRDCFFCFNDKPRKDELVVHGIPIDEPERAADVVRRYGLRSVGISGGEPLMFPERALRLVRVLRAMPERVRIDLYTNGDPATDELLRSLKDAGLDSVRFNLVANGFDTAPVERALRHFDDVTVEVPVVPALRKELEDMVLSLDRLGVPFLNIHELFACRENVSRVEGEGHEAGKEEPAATLHCAPNAVAEGGEHSGAPHSTLQWAPVAEGEEAALGLLLFGLENAKTLSVYYCSCRTQELIGSRGLRRRQRLAEARS